VRALWRRLGPPGARFARVRALGWIALGIIAYPLGWWWSVAFVTMASLYANVESGFATGAANDDRELKAAIRDEVRSMRAEMRDEFAKLRASVENVRPSGEGSR
jgi:hypothetical protein